MTSLRVVLGVSASKPHPASTFAESLGRRLAAIGFDVSLLVSDGGTEGGLVLPSGLTMKRLPESSADRASDVWLAAIRHLEELAPCVYVSSQDWLTARVSVRLSNRVQVIGILHENITEEYENCAQLGDAWNAIVALDPAIRQRVIGGQPAHAARLARFPEPDSDRGHLAESFAELIERTSHHAATGRFIRKQRPMTVPPLLLMPHVTRTEIDDEISRVNAVPAWPDPLPPVDPRTRRAARTRPPLEEHRIVFSVPTGRVSGVDVFSVNLVRSLASRGYRAEIVQTAPDAPIADRIPMLSGVPVAHLETGAHPTWSERWDAMRAFLEQRSPCIYVPNYDVRYSCIAPRLPDSVRVVGIAHSDDSQHYEHIVQLAPYWDAVVGVSSTITACVASLVPGIRERQWTIPYGVPIAAGTGKTRERNGPLRVVYSGRIARFQKRTQDLPLIAAALRTRGVDAALTVIGAGNDDDGSLRKTAGIHCAGAVPNDEVVRMLRESDVFILTSSFEGLPVSVLEAMESACVPIVTDIRSGVPQLIEDGVNGFVVPVGGIEEFVNRIALLSSDPGRLEKMRTAARETVVESHDIETVATRFLEMFAAVASDTSVRPSGSVVAPPLLAGVPARVPALPLPLRRALSVFRPDAA